jgi:hypothetical protein
MALVVTTITPALWYQPFVGPSQLVRQQSGVARAELVYYINGGSWPAAGADNDKQLDIGITLPKSYGYVLTDMTAQITNNSGYVYAQSKALVQVLPDDAATGPGSFWSYLDAPVDNYPAALGSSGGVSLSTNTEMRNSLMIVKDAPDTVLSKKVYNLNAKPTFLIYPWKNVQETSSVTSSFFDNFDNSDAYTVQYQARFLQFDVQQGYDYVLQSPVLTR